MPNRRHLGFGILSCALSAVVFAACGGSGSGGTGGASGAAAGRGGGASGGPGGSAGTAGLAGASGQSGSAGSAGQGGASAGQGGASAGQGGTSAGQGGASAGQGGASAGQGGASAGQGGASGAVAGGGGNGGNGGSNAGGGGTSGGQGGYAGTAGGAGAGGGSGQAGAAGSSGQAGSGASAGAGGAAGAGGVPASTFSCSDLGALDSDASSRTCFDFSDTSQGSSWMPDGGTWSIVNGQYVGTGPAAQVTCTSAGSLMTASLVDNFSAADVRVHVQMTSVDRPDKVIVLRSRDSGDRIELNFIAYWDNNGTQDGGFLSIQELVNCQGSSLAPVISIPHNVGDPITVDLELRGTQLTVNFNGSQIFDGAITVATDPGGVGVGVITGGTVIFDDFWVEALN